MALIPLQFVRRIRVQRLAWHRWSGRLLIILGVIVGISAHVMSFTMAIGGANETAATTLFAGVRRRVRADSVLREVGNRLREIHVRSARNKLWLEDLEGSDIDYGKVAEYLRDQGLAPLIVVELAYRPNTTITRPLKDDLRLSRMYAERIFGVKANA